MTHRSQSPPRPSVALALPLAGVLALAGCGATPAAEVIAGDGVLCDISQRLAADDLRVSCLLQPDDDPHQFRLTPEQSRAMGQARLVLINGYGLTPALARQSGGEGGAVAVAELAVPQSPLLENGHGHGDGDSHSHGDSHDQSHAQDERDPHVWHDPRQAAAMVGLISERLQALDPAAAGRIQQRSAAMQQVLEQLHQWNRRQFASIPGTPILATGHRAFASLARAYQLQELPLVDGSSSSDVLRPQELEAVLGQLRQRQVPSLLAEQLPASKAMARISAVSGVPLAARPLLADGLAPAEAGIPPNLISTLTANTCLIAASLQGRCDSQAQQQLISRWLAIR